MLSKEQYSKINTIYSNLDKTSEFEIMFNNYKKDNKLELNNFMNVLKYIKYLSDEKKYNLSEKISLDVIYGESKGNTYRVSINDIKNINSFLGLVHERKNHIIFSTLVSQYIDKDGYELIQKIKDKSNIVDIDEFDIRFRMSKELKVDNIDKLKQLPMSECDNIMFRYKQRITLQLTDSLVIDMTIVRSSSLIKDLHTVDKNFEIEIDYSPVGKKTSLDDIIKYTEDIKKVLSGNNILVNKTDSNNIITNYKKLVYGSDNLNFNNLYSMQPVSAEVQHIIDNIPNKYSATDKADGEKYQLYIDDKEAYLISNNLHLKKLDSKKYNIKDLNKTVLEGELIYLEDKQKYMFMAFDCLYYKGQNIMSNSNLSKRYNLVVECCKHLYNNKKIYQVKEFNYSGKYELDKVKSHYKSEIKNFFDELNKNTDAIGENECFIHPKFFLFCQGASNSEIFAYSDLIWENCTKNSDVNCPYMLDGIILTPLDQKYTREKQSIKLNIYKYKPPETNSIDIYIKFQRNKDTGGYLDIFDNQLTDMEFSTFRVVNFYVGENIDGVEKPVPFMPNNNNSQAYFPIINGQVRDVEGNIVQDNSVIEVIYNNDNSIPHNYRWSILRTRWDKTESVMRYKKKYGNYKTIAENVWKSMMEAVTINEIKNLAKEDAYEGQMAILRSRLTTTTIKAERASNKYYQLQTNIIKPMRQWHNWIKSCIIHLFAAPKADTQDGNIERQLYLDIGCGRGGDLEKAYHARVKEYVGFDYDYEGLFSTIDSITVRYNKAKNRYPDFPKATIFHADGKALLNSTAQSKAIPSMSEKNKKIIDSVFNGKNKFDVMSSQLVIHYLFESQTSVDNLVQNIKNNLNVGGYVLLSLFDGDIIHNSFTNDKITSMYTDDEGNRQKLFEIIKKYDGELKDEPGQTIDVQMRWISEDDYYSEYAVSKSYMIKTMKKAGCRLVDTDSFKNLYTINKMFFTETVKYESDPRNKKFYQNAGSFFGELKGIDKESMKYSFLHRYYIFQKIN